MENVENVVEEELEEVVEETTDSGTETEKNIEAKEDDVEVIDKDPKDKLIEELNDKYMRTFAEFDNFRKRTEKEKAAMFELGARSIIEKILPVIDNFERGFSTVEEEDKEDAFVKGMDMVYKQMLSTLEEAGVKAIDAVGQQFDPNLHNAVMHVDDENFGENEVAEEFQKGYTYRESVVRHSMVKVAN
ncbi:MAG: nucleotide exchange factor GrpE [Lachnospiraceae bacterium]|nr:nucleotide exchange factor GrpE [Lachnospiraceae bacterium]